MPFIRWSAQTRSREGLTAVALTSMKEHKLPLLAVAIVCVLGVTLLGKVVDHRKCAMTYMWPSYFSLAELSSFREKYALVLYKEGRHVFNARKLQCLHCFFAVVGETHRGCLYRRCFGRNCWISHTLHPWQ